MTTARPLLFAVVPLALSLLLALPAAAQGRLTARAAGDDAGSADVLVLESESLRVDVDQQYATTTLQQVYRNRSAGAVEGTYTLQAGSGATVHGFAYWNGEQKIVGEVFEKDTAREVYQEVTGLGRDPGLLEQSGEGAFTFRVFPIEPGERKRVEIRFGQRLARTSGSGVEYRVGLAHGDGVSSDVFVDVRDDRELGAPRSTTHKLDVDRAGTRALRFRATPLRPATGELVFAYDVKQAPWQPSAVLHRDAGQDGYLLVTLPTPALGEADVSAKDVTVVIDHSGSMSGAPMEQAKLAAEAVIARLRLEDRVNVLMFDNRVDALFPSPRPVPEARADALAFVRRIQAGGGTDIALALGKALAAQQTQGGRPQVILFFTDGQSDSRATLEVARKDSGNARVFTIGLGTGVEKPLLSRLASTRRGRFTFIPSADAIQGSVTHLFTEIEKPLLLDVELEVAGKGARLERVYPRTLPDLVPGDELVAYGRVVGPAQKTPLQVIVRGRLGQKAVAYRVAAVLPERAARPFVGRLWAQARVDDLLEEIALAGEQDELKNEVVELALAYNLVTKYTSFLAIPEGELTDGARATLATARARKKVVLDAHPDAVALSRTAMPPGDPLLTVRAPATSLQVTAYFAFGLVKDLTWDPRHERWEVRFLVPKTVADGLYEAQIVIVRADGTIEMGHASYTIDSSEPDFDVELSPIAGGVEVLVTTSEPARSVTVCEAAELRPLRGDDLTRARSQNNPDSRSESDCKNGRRVELHSARRSRHVFAGFLPLAIGPRQVRVVVADTARNEADRTVYTTVEK